jgi:hypothetical protein
MSNIQKTLNALQPYVIGIRYLEGTALVDVVFTEGWVVSEEPKIKKVKGDEGMNYYMLFSEDPTIGLDELLASVEKTIKLNLEREKKHELLRLKVNELKELFKKTSLTKLNSLRFTFSDEDMIPNLNDFDIDLDEETIAPTEPNELNITEITEEVIFDETIDEVRETPEDKLLAYLDEDGKAIELTEEERELIEEEQRAERNRKFTHSKKKTINNKPVRKVELPPRKKMESAFAEMDYDTECDCGPNDACSKCIDSKDY